MGKPFKSGDIRFWLGLNNVPNIKKSVYKNLIQNFGSAYNVFKASVEELSLVTDFKTAQEIKRFNGWEKIDKEIELLKKHSISVITISDSKYPKNLLSINDPPQYLYVKGIIQEYDRLAIAVVGTRAPSYYGTTVAEKIAQELAQYGVTVVSGLARGIDSAAHRGALSGKGRTIAVLGCGIDIVYPRENKKLFEEIAEKGAVISEFPIGTPPLPHNFPLRNRIISGLSLGVLVVEASLRSGSLITARLALEYNRDVFCIPGAITSDRSKGTNKLIKDGAKLVESVKDILEDFYEIRENRKKEGGNNLSLSKEESKVLDLLDGGPIQIDTIIQRTHLSPAEISTLLLEMEIKGLIEQQPGKIFYRRQGE
ncbi:MAG: DNA-protecting protein DprA [Deltaproteobacteria bacterium]|nr:DNA-protecting protein DprA [Deltaproteobacteria bacterium]